MYGPTGLVTVCAPNGKTCVPVFRYTEGSSRPLLPLPGLHSVAGLGKAAPRQTETQPFPPRLYNGLPAKTLTGKAGVSSRWTSGRITRPLKDEDINNFLAHAHAPSYVVKQESVLRKYGKIAKEQHFRPLPLTGRKVVALVAILTTEPLDYRTIEQYTRILQNVCCRRDAWLYGPEKEAVRLALLASARILGKVDPRTAVALSPLQLKQLSGLAVEKTNGVEGVSAVAFLL